MKTYLKAYLTHMGLNLGSAFACFFHTIIPPQYTNHSEIDLARLGRGSFLSGFLEGISSGKWVASSGEHRTGRLG